MRGSAVRKVPGVVATIWLFAASVVHAQSTDPARAYLTRAELEELRVRYEEAASSGAYSAQVRERARTELALIEARMTQGDFRTGDVIHLSVEGEPGLEGDYTVAMGPAIILPKYGEIPLQGVLRSELQDHITKELARYIRNPVVRTSSRIQISVLGEVLNPGFYRLAADTPITDVLTLAGGPTREAKLTEIRIERADERIWEGRALQEAITESRTLDQLGLRAGDRIVVPVQEGRRDLLWGLLGIIPTIYAVVELVR